MLRLLTITIINKSTTTHINQSINQTIDQSSPNTQLFGATYLGDEANKRGGRRDSNGQQPSSLLHQITQISPNGRYGAPRPTCSMAEVLKHYT